MLCYSVPYYALSRFFGYCLSQEAVEAPIVSTRSINSLRRFDVGRWTFLWTEGLQVLWLHDETRSFQLLLSSINQVQPHQVSTR